MITLFMLGLAQSTSATMNVTDFSRACVQAGGGLTHFPASSTGGTSYRSAYIGGNVARTVQISTYSGGLSGGGGNVDYRLTSMSSNVSQSIAPNDNFTVHAVWVRYNLNISSSPTSVCVRILP